MSGAVAVVTGAGIGRAIARSLLHAGFRVALLDRTDPGVDRHRRSHAMTPSTRVVATGTPHGGAR